MTNLTHDRRSTPDLVDLVSIMEQGRIRDVSHVVVDGVERPFLGVHHNEHTRAVQARVQVGYSVHRVTFDWMR